MREERAVIFNENYFTNEPDTDGDLLVRMSREAIKKHSEEKGTDLKFVHVLRANYHPGGGIKSTYLHRPEGKKRLEHINQEGEELNAFDQLELGPMRTLLYGAIAGACSEAATYPFEVVRRRLQMQLHAKKLSVVATCVKIIEK